jgi:hypothetical protein
MKTSVPMNAMAVKLRFRNPSRSFPDWRPLPATVVAILVKKGNLPVRRQYEPQAPKARFKGW